MRLVRFTDRGGWKHLAMVRDADPDSIAPEGLRLDPPDIRQLDWEGIIQELHNGLVDAGLINWEDVQRQQNGLSGVVQRVLRDRLTVLYREAAKATTEGGSNHA